MYLRRIFKPLLSPPPPPTSTKNQLSLSFKENSIEPTALYISAKQNPPHHTPNHETLPPHPRPHPRCLHQHDTHILPDHAPPSPFSASSRPLLPHPPLRQHHINHTPLPPPLHEHEPFLPRHLHPSTRQPRAGSSQRCALGLWIWRKGTGRERGLSGEAVRVGKR